MSKFRTLIFTIILIGFLNPTSSIADYENGKEAYDSGDFETAFKEWIIDAEKGVASAQWRIGTLYLYGKGVNKSRVEANKWISLSADQNFAPAQYYLGTMLEEMNLYGFQETAAKWYLKAAKQGYSLAQNRLGVMYDLGLGIDEDKAEAIKWYRTAADNGYSNANYNLGVIYYNGNEVAQDRAEATRLWELAASQGLHIAKRRLEAEKGDAKAQAAMGNYYESILYCGVSCPKNYVEAAQWYKLSAAQGYIGGQFQLAYYYSQGIGVPEDYVLSYKWYIIVAAKGHKVAMDEKEKLKTKMTPEQIAEAQKMARKWLEKQKD